MNVMEDYNEAVTKQARVIEGVLDDLWRSNVDSPADRLEAAAQQLTTSALTLRVLAGAIRDGADACETIRQLAGC